MESPLLPENAKRSERNLYGSLTHSFSLPSSSRNESACGISSNVGADNPSSSLFKSFSIPGPGAEIRNGSGEGRNPPSLVVFNKAQKFIFETSKSFGRDTPRIAFLDTPHPRAHDVGGPLEPPSSSFGHTLSNIIVSIVGSSLLGLPYAFRSSGWVTSLFALVILAIISYHGMTLLVKTKRMEEEKDKTGEASAHLRDEQTSPFDSVRTPSRTSNKINSYGDLAHSVFGSFGERVVQIMIVLNQGGCCIAYLMFMSQNVSNVFFGDTRYKNEIIMVLVPLQMIFSWLRSLDALAPFSLLADVINMLAFGTVLYFSVMSFHGFSDIRAFRGIQSAPMAFGVILYALQGAGMTLSLESSMKAPSQFPSALSFGLTLISLLYAAVGTLGYFGYAENTQEIVTLNLPQGSFLTHFVQLGISFALFFTFPVMMYPVHEVFETWFRISSVWKFRVIRCLVISLVGAVAVGVPHFSAFLSLVGSSLCVALGFVLPAVMHIKVSGNNISRLEVTLDLLVVFFGVVFGVWGTYDSINKLLFE